MNKKEAVIKIDALAKKVAKSSKQSEARAKKFIEGLFLEISEDLKTEEKISLGELGIFKKKHVDRHAGYNPQQKKKITIAAHNKITFKPSSHLANSVNKKYRNLKPNVIEEMKLLTGLKKEDLKTLLTPERETARKRAKITLGFIAAMLLVFFTGILFIPAVFKKTDDQSVQFVRNLNTMMGLNSISDRIANNLPEVINEDLLGKYISQIKQSLAQNRKVIKKHVVGPGDSIYSIANKYYGSQYLWPDLYYLNKSSFEDPNLLKLNDTITVYEKLGDPDNLSESQSRSLVQAYITMYRVSRALGEKEIADKQEKKGSERIRESTWTLYTALRYDNDLLDIYEEAIYPEDIEIVESYIKRFGYGVEKKKEFWDI